MKKPRNTNKHKRRTFEQMCEIEAKYGCAAGRALYTPPPDMGESEKHQYEKGKYYVGNGTEEFPGIISGPFDSPPKLKRNHRLWTWDGLCFKPVEACL